MSNNRHTHPVHNEKQWSWCCQNLSVSKLINSTSRVSIVKTVKKGVDRIIFFHHKMCNTILLAQLYWKSNKSSPLPRLPHFCSCSLFKTKINSWSSSMPLKAIFTKHAKTCFLRVFCLFHIESYFKKICLVSTFECKLG